VPLQKLQFRPGVNREGTTLANEGGWFESDKVRFRSGYPEKIGGWSVIDGTYNKFIGVCRSLWNWATLKGFILLGVGTNLKFYIAYGGEYFDITPIRETTIAGAVTFAATNGSSTITVTDTSWGGQTGDFVTFSGAVALNNSTQTYTVNAGTDVLTLTNPLTNGTQVNLFTTGAVPGGLSLSTTYYVVDASGSTCKLSLISGGAAVNITNTGTGTQSLEVATGITAGVLNQQYQVTFLTTDTYTIQARTAGTSVEMPGAPVLATASDVGNGGAATVGAYEISTGSDIYTSATGWGAGPWNGAAIGVSTDSWAHGWGTGYPALGIDIQLRLWSQINFGEILLFSPRGGALYYWAPGATTTPDFGTPGQEVTGVYVPTKINQIMVSDASRIVIALGANPYDGSDLDPLLIRWSDQESYTNWDPTDVTRTAGFQRLSHGSYIVAGLQTRQEILVWTDAALYTMQFVGLPYVWRFDILADNISIISPDAMATANGVTYWMGTDKFYMYSGRVETLPCALRSYVFNDINKNQAWQVVSGTNEGFSEIWWFYCSANSTVVDRYVIFNYLDRVWYYGTMGRTAWLDSPLRQYPQAATYDGLTVFHESAVDDGTTNPPTAISAYVQSSDFDIGDGHNYGFVWQIIPDITFDGSVGPAPTDPGNPTNYPQVTFTVRPRQNPGSNYGTADTPTVQSTKSYAPSSVYNVQEFTEIVYTRVRGRQMAFKVSSDTLGTQWQLGTPRINVRPDGRR
jgi:hypothetical protein